MPTTPAPFADLATLYERAGGRIYIRPTGLLAGADAAAAVARGAALRLAGGRIAFAAAEVTVRAGSETRRTTADAALLAASGSVGSGFGAALDARLDRLTAPRPPFAGLPLDRPRIMAVVNVTPDSFSDGGAFLDPSTATAHARGCLEAGADLIDLGAESTRPFAAPVSQAEESARLRPVLADLTTAPGPDRLSVDTRRAGVMAAALDAGVPIINDVTALTHDPAALPLAAERGAAVVLMHMQGDPQTMQAAPRYDDAALDVFDVLEHRVAACAAAGIDRGRILVDPGIGFGKTLDHNLEILRALTLFHGLGCGLLVGVSRKSWIARLVGDVPPGQRLAGSLAGALHAWNQGAQVVRVHDVPETVQARAVWEALHPVW